jgi:hypothetical protein
MHVAAPRASLNLVPDDDFDPKESVTLVTCLSCGGDFRRLVQRPDGTYVTHLCEHCTQGSMTDAQVQAYKVLRTTRPPDD